MSPKQQFDKIRLNSVFPPAVTSFSRLFDPALSMSATEAARAAPLQESEYFNQRLQLLKEQSSISSIAQTERSPD